MINYPYQILNASYFRYKNKTKFRKRIHKYLNVKHDTFFLDIHKGKACKTKPKCHFRSHGTSHLYMQSNVRINYLSQPVVPWKTIQPPHKKTQVWRIKLFGQNFCRDMSFPFKKRSLRMKELFNSIDRHFNCCAIIVARSEFQESILELLVNSFN